MRSNRLEIIEENRNVPVSTPSACTFQALTGTYICTQKDKQHTRRHLHTDTDTQTDTPISTHVRTMKLHSVDIV